MGIIFLIKIQGLEHRARTRTVTGASWCDLQFVAQRGCSRIDHGNHQLASYDINHCIVSRSSNKVYSTRIYIKGVIHIESLLDIVDIDQRCVIGIIKCANSELFGGAVPNKIQIHGH